VADGKLCVEFSSFSYYQWQATKSWLKVIISTSFN